MHNKKLKLKCNNCGKDYSRYKANNRPQSFCSRKCYLSSNQNREVQRKRMTGMSGDKNYNWVGDKVKYKSLHRWIEIQLGLAKNHVCKFCEGKSGSATMNWANLDHRYTRDLSKWVPLCKICHSIYDQKMFNSYSGPKSESHKRALSKSKIKKKLLEL